MRQLKRQPRHGDALHPRADGGNDLAGQKETEIPMSQRAEHSRSCDLLHSWDHRRVSTMRESVVIQAPPERVWSVVQEDVEHAPRWSSNLAKVEKLDDGPPGKGTRYRYHLDLPGGMRETIGAPTPPLLHPHACAGK